MATTNTFIRLILNDRIRKQLGINLKNKKIYVFKLSSGKTYISTDTVPKSVPYATVYARLGTYRWYINIPMKYLDYTPYKFRLLNVKGKVLELVPEDVK